MGVGLVLYFCLRPRPRPWEQPPLHKQPEGTAPSLEEEAGPCVT